MIKGPRPIQPASPATEILFAFINGHWWQKHLNVVSLCSLETLKQDNPPLPAPVPGSLKDVWSLPVPPCETSRWQDRKIQSVHFRVGLKIEMVLVAFGI